MSQSEKAKFYNALKAAGVNFDRHYREYNTTELKAAWEALQAGNAVHDDNPQESAPDPEAAAFYGFAEPEPEPEAPRPATPHEQRLLDQANGAPTGPQPPVPPVQQRNPNEMPGVRQNTKPEDEPIRVDEHGLVWYQEEVRKPAFPKPRGRRVLQYMDTGTKEVSVQNGEYVETFEVSGERPAVPAQVKITLPSFQVGIYKDRRFPFKIHIYNENRGFDLFEVQNFYGGSELVPPEIKKVYIENVLCYDIRTTVRAIQTEHRQLQLQGKVK